VISTCNESRGLVIVTKSLANAANERGGDASEAVSGSAVTGRRT
jgi:hypothetical protein